MDVKFCRRCDKVRYSPCGIVCHASNDQAAQEKAIIALHERDMRQHALNRQVDTDRRAAGHQP